MAGCSKDPFQNKCVRRCNNNENLSFCPELCASNSSYGFCTTEPPPLTPEEQQAADSLYLSFAEGFGVATLFCVAGFALAAILNLIKR